MTLQNLCRKLYEPFLDLSCAVTHYKRLSKFPYVCWTEEGEDTSFHADGHKEEQQLTGTVDFFTKDEFDSIADDIQDILNSEPIGWKLSTVQYEDETNLIHYQWIWWVI